MAVSGLGVMYTATGFLLVYSGLKNVTLKDELSSFLKGSVPPANLTGAPTIGIAGSGGGGSSGSSGGASTSAAPGSGGGDSSIATDALKYVGHKYLYGGAPGTNGSKPWDCSSFCNWVLGHDLGLPIPGYGYGQYDGSVHGPTTLQYLVWSNATTVSHSSKDAKSGDLCVWQTHMGIAIGNGQMVSALNESLGTKVTSIDGTVPGEQLFVRRIK